MIPFFHARRFACLCAVGLFATTGCGTNLIDVATQTANAAATTAFDNFLTFLANSLIDSTQPGTTTPPDQDGDQPDIDDTTPFDQLTPDPTAGQTLYLSNACGACHCPDATGGCALNAPSLIGVSNDTLDSFLRGSAAHPGGKFSFSNQDIVDLQSFLAGN